MSEETKTAETTESYDLEIDSHADVDQENYGVNEANFTDGAGTPKAEKGNTKKQDNSANSRRRREAERKAELEQVRQAAREAAIIETLNGINPFTNEEMKDSTDVEEYLLMKDIENNGGDPISDYAKHVKAKKKDDMERERKSSADKEWYDNDRRDFTAKFPDVDVSALIRDPHFVKFADGKVGEKPLSEIYSDYTEMYNGIYAEATAGANKKAAQSLANAKASPGALSGADTGASVYFTPEQVRKMSKAEVHRNYDKIRESMKRWK